MIISINSVSYRLYSLRIKKYFDYSILNAYIPTKEKSYDVKDVFYEELEWATYINADLYTKFRRENLPIIGINRMLIYYRYK